MIFCVEDDAAIRDIEVYAMRSTGFEAEGFADGTAFWEALQTQRPELVVLDVMLPGMDGVQLLRKLRADGRFADIPVIMATAKGTEYDKIQSLDLGADDYVVKPFGVMELISRIKAVLRRCQGNGQKRLQLEGLSLDLEEHTVSVDGQRVQLTFKEYQLLRLFLSHPGMALPGISFLTRSGAKTIWARAELWICTFAPCGKKWVHTESISKRCVM